MGISETSLSKAESSHLYKNITNEFISYFTNNDENRGSDTGLLIAKELDNHVFNFYDYKERIIMVDLAFKGNLKLCIIQCYLPGKQHNKSIIEDYHLEIKRLISKAK